MSANNFDLLRLLLASIVVLVHARVLSNAPELACLSRWLNSDYAVHGFFVISGFLICRSYEGSTSCWHYVVKRARRLLPGYVSVVLLGVLIGWCVTSYSSRDYLLNPTTLKYLVSNLSFLNFLQPSLPGVFESNPFGAAVNGSLWSIRTEILCYALVPLLFQAASWFSLRIASLGCVALFTLLNAATYWEADGLSPTLVAMVRLGICECGQCFAVGAVAYTFRSHLQSRQLLYASLASLTLLTIGILDATWVRVALGPWILGVTVLGVGLAFPYLGNWTRYGDFSYGIYVVHFPIIQVLVDFGVFKASPLGALVGMVIATVALAILSWRLIESPWLAKGNHYRLAAGVSSSGLTLVVQSDGERRSVNGAETRATPNAKEKEDGHERRAA